MNNDDHDIRLHSKNRYTVPGSPKDNACIILFMVVIAITAFLLVENHKNHNIGTEIIASNMNRSLSLAFNHVSSALHVAESDHHGIATVLWLERANGLLRESQNWHQCLVDLFFKGMSVPEFGETIRFYSWTLLEIQGEIIEGALSSTEVIELLQHIHDDLRILSRELNTETISSWRTPAQAAETIGAVQRLLELYQAGVN